MARTSAPVVVFALLLAIAACLLMAASPSAAAPSRTIVYSLPGGQVSQSIGGGAGGGRSGSRRSSSSRSSSGGAASLVRYVVAAAPSSSQISYQPAAPIRQESDEEPVARPVYNYGWQLTAGDDEGGPKSNFGQSETRDGDQTSGRYHVQLADGRLQTVEYFDNGDGLVAKVTFQGKAWYPDPAPAAPLQSRRY